MATFDFDGQAIRVIPPRELTLGDLAYMKEHFDIPGQAELEQGLGDMEPHPWRAFLVASIRLAQPTVDPKTAVVDHVVVSALVETMNEERMAEIEAQEKADRAKKGGTRPTGGSGSSRARSGPSSSA